jgi:hypothetical protein
MEAIKATVNGWNINWDVLSSPSSWPISPLTLVAISIPTYLILRSIYRLYFHPLAKFPGPKLPALTGWYEFYYECILGGRYFEEILRMHEQYGIHASHLLLNSSLLTII